MLSLSETPLILTLDNAGKPINWINWQEAATLYVRQQVAWTGSETSFRFYGGTCQKTGLRSFLDVCSIIAIRGAKAKHNLKTAPLLTNRALFERDRQTCLYCGNHFSSSLLTRDHVRPRAQGGQDIWNNVVAACKACNAKKSCYTPHQAHMPLLALPYIPNKAEAMILENRKILTDQMDFLRKHVPRERRDSFN